MVDGSFRTWKPSRLTRWLLLAPLVLAVAKLMESQLGLWATCAIMFLCGLGIGLVFEFGLAAVRRLSVGITAAERDRLAPGRDRRG